MNKGGEFGDGVPLKDVRSPGQGQQSAMSEVVRKLLQTGMMQASDDLIQRRIYVQTPTEALIAHAKQECEMADAILTIQRLKEKYSGKT